MSIENKYAIIVAGGSGLRMNADAPKQFLLLKGKPILMHTITKFWNAGSHQIIVVLPQVHMDYWKSLCVAHDFNIEHTLVDGGEERFNSVKNGLAGLQNKQGLVAIHDGVRPCLSEKLINDCFEFAALNGNAIAAVSLKDSIRKINDNKNEVVNRNEYKLIQTPQVFNLNAIVNAYNKATSFSFTDDASVFETAGHTINLVQGEYQNIKITTTEDLKIADVFM